MQRYYNQIKGQSSFGGIFFFWQPLALIVDLDLVKHVLVKDFQHFHDRGMFYNEKDDPISAHLFNIEGDRWTNLRKKLSPTFSSGKMKMMFPTLVDVGNHFIERLTNDTEKDPEVEMKDILARFTTDVIGSCAFGIDCNSLNDPETEFRVMGKKVFEIPTRKLMNFIKFPFMLTFKDFSRKIGLKSTNEDVAKFFMKVVKDTLEYREKNNVQRNDFMNLLMQIKNTGKLEGSDENVGKLSFNEIAAQAFVFFLAGFETSSTTMTFCLHELSLNEDIQEKARKCAQEAIEQHGGLTYEAVMDMHYIEQCVNGTIHK
jgi:cytochrome P450 family 6